MFRRSTEEEKAIRGTKRGIRKVSEAIRYEGILLGESVQLNKAIGIMRDNGLLTEEQVSEVYRRTKILHADYPGFSETSTVFTGTLEDIIEGVVLRPEDLTFEGAFGFEEDRFREAKAWGDERVDRILRELGSAAS